MGEKERIRDLYETRDAASLSGADQWATRWSPRNLQAVYYRQRVEAAVIAALNATKIDLRGCEILDVGCGGGTHLRFLAEIGAERRRLHGIDLVPDRIERGLDLAPDLDLRVADATDLPFANDSFDLVAQFTALCNLTEEQQLQQAAHEMARVLRPGGSILSFDIASARRGAPYRTITLDDLEELFAPLTPVFVRPLFHRWTELLSARARELCGLLERLPLPKSNLLAILR